MEALASHRARVLLGRSLTLSSPRRRPRSGMSTQAWEGQQVDGVIASIWFEPTSSTRLPNGRNARATRKARARARTPSVRRVACHQRRMRCVAGSVDMRATRAMPSTVDYRKTTLGKASARYQRAEKPAPSHLEVGAIVESARRETAGGSTGRAAARSRTQERGMRWRTLHYRAERGCRVQARPAESLAAEGDCWRVAHSASRRR